MDECFNSNNINLNQPIEFLPSGVVYAGKVEPRIFTPNIYLGKGPILVTDCLRIIFCIILLFFLVIDIKNKIQTSVELEDILTLKQILTIFILVLYLASFIIKILYLNQDPGYFYNHNANSYIDTYTLGYYYNQIYFIESVLFEGVSLKLLDFLILNDNIKLFFDCINIGIKSFFKYCILLMTIYIGYATIAFILYGPFLDDFSTFQGSLSRMLMMSIGYYNLKSLITFCASWGTLYILTFFLVFILFVYIVFIGLFAEAVKKTVVQNGYPDDYDDSQWQFKDYIVWLCHFVKDDEKNNKK